MPELPEVHTMVQGLRKAVKGKVIVGLWTEWLRYFKYPGTESGFKKVVLGRRILDVDRLGKNILFQLSGGRLLLVHQKMTGRFLVGKWNGAMNKDGIRNATHDPKDRFVRLIMFLSGGMALSFIDVRKFGKFMAGPAKDILGSADAKNVGVDPLSKLFTLDLLLKSLAARKVPIKIFLLDQRCVSGIGNIYADETLWHARVSPLKRTNALSGDEARRLFNSMKFVLKRGIKFGGSSISDYRDAFGRRGRYQDHFFVYRRGGFECSRCGSVIKRIKIGSRSTSFCPRCQLP